MSDAEKVEVELPAENVEPKVEEKATEKDFVEAGFAPEEIQMAKEQGMLKEESGEGEKKNEGKEKGEESKKEPESKEKQEGKKAEEGEKVDIDSETLSDKDIKTKLDELENPDGTIKDKRAHGLYSQMRRDRRRRQEAEAAARRKEVENKYLSENLEKIKSEQEKIEQELTDLKDKGNEFLTDEEKERRSELREKEKELKAKETEIDVKAKKEQENREKAQNASRILNETEQEFIKSHPDIDFNKCAEYANEVLVSLKKGEVDSLFDGDEMKSAYAEKLARRFVDNSVKLAQGDIIDEELPVLVYKMAKIHPKYNNGSKEKPEMKGKDLNDGKIKPDIDRMMRNAERRNTAALGSSGGGRIKVSEDDLTWTDAIRLPKREFDKLSQATIDRLLRESCK